MDPSTGDHSPLDTVPLERPEEDVSLAPEPEILVHVDECCCEDRDSADPPDTPG